jgi:putative endonuclease
MWYVYVLKCLDNALYIGLTNNLKRRFEEHSQGKGGYYTSYNRPTDILYYEIFENRPEAEKREQQLKRWSRAKKLALLKGNLVSLRNLSISREK